MAKVGGKRPGAGRPKGARNKATIQAKQAIADLAQEHTDIALTALVAIATKGESEAAKVSAAVAILDRAYGKPAQAQHHSAPDGGAIRMVVSTGIDRHRGLDGV